MRFFLFFVPLLFIACGNDDTENTDSVFPSQSRLSLEDAIEIAERTAMTMANTNKHTRAEISPIYIKADRSKCFVMQPTTRSVSYAPLLYIVNFTNDNGYATVTN